MPEDEHESRFGSLARNMEALSSETRLELLHALRTPQALHEIRVLPSISREGESPGRSLSRQSVTHHLDMLVDLGLVHRTAAKASSRGEAYVLNHERLFAVVDEIRSLSRLRPIDLPREAPSDTMTQGDGRAIRLAALPRLLLAYGRDDGVSFPLQGPLGTRWRIGRGAECEVALDYDPYLSAENSAVERSEGGFLLRDLCSRNGTWVNWERFASGETRMLVAGDLVRVGRSLLVYQA